MADTFGLKIGLEGEKEFKKALAEINQSFKVLGSEMKLVDDASAIDGKVLLLAVCGKNAVKNGANAGKIVKTAATICGGGGGGRPDSASAGGKDASKIFDALASVESSLSL